MRYRTPRRVEESDRFPAAKAGIIPTRADSSVFLLDILEDSA